ncbi:MAG: hypothetical protein WCA47_14090 [Terriglobales bacterium]
MWGKNSESNDMKSGGLHIKGFTLIATLLMLLLLSGIAIGLLMMVTTEGKVGGTDLQNNQAYHAAEGGIEKMASDLNATIQNISAPTPSQICALSNLQPTLSGVTWKDYSVMPGTAQGSSCPSTLSSTWGVITGSGQNAGLKAQIIPVNMLATASMPGGQEVSMTRQAQVALIPAFQFGVFSEGDLLFENGGNLDFAGPVHTNSDLYPFSAGTLTFHYPVSAYGNVIRYQLPNGIVAAGTYANPVYIPSAAGDCSAPGAAVTGSCTAMSVPTNPAGPNYGDGSVTGAGTSTAQPAANNNPVWSTFSKSTTNLMLTNGNYGSQTNPGTGAKKLSLSFVSGGAQPYEIIRRPPVGEDTNSAISQAREYNMAQIRVLLSDDPTEFQNGTGWSDSQNVRLANLTTTQASLQGGNATATNPWGITMTAGNYGSAFGSPTSGNNFTLYFAAASNAVPIPANCSGATCPTPEWPYAPHVWASGSAPLNPFPSTQGLQPTTLAPTFLNNGATPSINLCTPTGVAAGNVPIGCPSTQTYPYYALPNPNLPVASGALTAYNSGNSNAWSLIDGYLRVEYKDATGVWHPVTTEWLGLGFARGTAAPTANGAGLPVGGISNPINPNAILLLQAPADRLTTAPASLTGTTVPAEPAASGASAPSVATAPVCTHTVSGVCTTWTLGVPPLLASDSGSGGQWAFGVTPTAPSATTPQSLTQYNWYPINFYDAREGEVREQDWTSGTVASASDTTCTTNGVMNAVEIDVGNLKRWLAGQIGTSGAHVDYAAQNGYVLYFSDRRGMLLNPHPPLGGAATKTGDSGLEDIINSSSQTGTPDGVLDPVPSGRTYSPEDVNENGYLDNFGAANLGLGFYGITGNTAQNLNTLVNSNTSRPDPFGTGGSGSAGYTTNRIAVCGTTGRKNWVSGARHVLKLVDGSLGNLPLRPSPIAITSGGTTTNYWGGFTVASENPVYIQGDYNSVAGDTTWNATPSDETGMAAAAVIADAVTLVSNNWDDRRSTLGVSGSTSPTYRQNRPASTQTYYRVAIASGKNMNFTSPSWVTSANDVGIDGAVGNFMRLLEDWGSSTLNYKGSIVSLYYSTYETGIFKCCQEVYVNGNRNYIFDLDFNSPYGLPPGTPMFHDVETLGYRQMFSARTN